MANTATTLRRLLITGLLYVSVLTPATGASCVDLNKLCPRWAADGECNNNRPWMTANCRKSCDKCDTPPACIDAYGKANCGQWRSNGQCEKNPVWMAANCRQSCQQCDGDPVEATSPLTQSDSHKGMILTNETHILISDGFTVKTLIEQPHGNIVGLAVDVNAGLIFWANNARGTIYRANMDGSEIESIVSEGVLEVNGLSADWLAGQLYWTDAQTRRIELVRYDGSSRKVIVRSGLFSPRGIVVDPESGYLYWNDQGMKQIEMAKMDGSEREVLVNASSLYWPNQMALAADSNGPRSLYWVDAWDRTLKSVDVDTRVVRTEADLAVDVADSVVFGVALAGPDTVYVTVWSECNVLAVDLTDRSVKRLFPQRIGTDVLFSVVAPPNSPPQVAHPCRESNRGGCSHLCIPTGGATYRCACPSIGGLVLASDRKTCRLADQFLLYCRADVGEVGFVVVDSPQNSGAIYVVGRSARPVGVAYDPLTQYVYWSDVQEKAIHRAYLNGTGREVFLNVTNGVGYVDGLYIDWRRRKLYFTNTDFVSIDKVAYTWHKIEVIDLEGQGRSTIISDVEMPRGLWVDNARSELYYTDWGALSLVSRSSLDGATRTVLQRDVHDPTAVAVSSGRVYVLDSHYRARQRGEKIDGAAYVTDRNGASWERVDALNLKNPFGLAVSAGKLYVSDWGHRAIISYDIATQTQHVVMEDVTDAMGLFYIDERVAMTDKEDGPCSSRNCESMCFENSRQVAHCTCSSYSGTFLSDDKVTCDAADNFLLVADMFGVKMAALGATDRGVSLAAQRNGIPASSVSALGTGIQASVSALVYDATTKQIFYSDVSRRQLFSRAVPPRGRGDPPRPLYDAPPYIADGLALHAASRTLYWTASEGGAIGRLDLRAPNASHALLLTGLDAPRAIAVHSRTGDIYWTEVGLKAKVMTSRRDGDFRRVVMDTTAVTQPNGLHLDESRGTLYVLDSHNGAIHKCLLRGLSCSVLLTLPLASRPFYDLYVYGDFVYYSSWTDKAITMVNRVTGHSEVVLSDLVRPSQFFIHHPSDVSAYCTASGGECEGPCLPYPGGHQCSCHPGSRLLSDRRSCTPMPEDADRSVTNVTAVTTPSGDTLSSDTLSGDVLTSSVSSAISSGDTVSRSVTSDVTMSDDAPVTPTTTSDTSLAPPTMSDTSLAPPTTSNTPLVPPTKSDTSLAPPSTSDTSQALPSTDDTSLAPPTTSDTSLAPPTTSDTSLAPSTTSDTSLALPTTSDTSLAPPTTSDTSLAHPTPSDRSLVPPTTSDTSLAPSTTSDTSLAPPTTSDTSLAPLTMSDTSMAPPTTKDTSQALPTTSDTSLATPTTSDTSLAMPTMSDTSLAPPTTSDTSLAQPTTSDTSLTTPTTSDTSLALPTTSDTSLAPLTTSDRSLAPPTMSDTPLAPPTTSDTTKEDTSTIPEIHNTPTAVSPSEPWSSVKRRVTVATKATSTTAKPSVTGSTRHPPTSPDGTDGVPDTTDVVTTTFPSTDSEGTVVFTFCPRSRTVMSNGDGEAVWWRDPVASDGTARVAAVASTPSGSRFALGTTAVVYTATSNQTGRRAAVCTFNITVQSQGFVCDRVPSPLGGAVECSNVNYVYRCHVACDEDRVNEAPYDLNSTCRTDGWTPAFPDGYEVMACLEVEPLYTQRVITVHFAADCPTAVMAAETARVIEYVVDAVRSHQAALCGATGLCDPDRYELACDATSRAKRAVGQLLLTVTTFWLPAGAEDEVTALLEGLLRRGLLRVTGVGGRVYEGKSVSQRVVSTGCPRGMVQRDQRCVVCPAGGHHDATVGRCLPCPAGQYQSEPAQTACLPCPPLTTSQPGAFTRHQCVTPPVPTEPPPGDDEGGDSGRWSVVLVVVLSVAVGCVLVASLVVAAVTSRRLVRHRRGKMALHQGGAAPSVVNYANAGFAAAPPGGMAGTAARPRYAVSSVPEGLHDSPGDLDPKGDGVTKVIPLSAGSRLPPSGQKSAGRKYRLTNGDQLPARAQMVQTGVYQKREPPSLVTGWHSLSMAERTTQ